ncbi:hypothetical protein BS50DRAFT_638830 [Corynespora cassiicola Philippines]|uniref:Uncharacterized protein n=1 Tax=Corynespora cassiicola Philippines TaxID=1448308 RepID=A0A2T2N9Z1_CORCC|nr:hypothetical protein BS50DRAFT_638830 [Corynespora cassiicola Philippines]
MDHGALPALPCPPHPVSGYVDAFVYMPQAAHDVRECVVMLDGLVSQKRYLEGQLSKTVTTLNALRDRQTRNEQALRLNPSPRSKKKKMQQNRWRTDKTIKTCENEERVLLDCLHVCKSNMHTLARLMNPPDLSSTAVEHHSSTSKGSYEGSEATEFDWNGWKDSSPLSPFQKKRQLPVTLDEMPPEERVDEPKAHTEDAAERGRPPPLPLRKQECRMAALRPVSSQPSLLSPEVASFEPAVAPVRQDEDLPKAMDKLSISGLLASKCMQHIQKRWVSDVGTGNAGGYLSDHARPELANMRGRASWGGPEGQTMQAGQGRRAAGAARKRLSV